MAKGKLGLEIPEYGSEVKDASGAVVGAAKYDPNTGKELSAPRTTQETSTSGGTPSPYYPRYTNQEKSAAEYIDTFQAPQTEEQLYSKRRNEAQSEIDAINQLASSKLEEQRVINEGRDRGTNAISALTGLSGSTEANIAADKTTALNKRDNDKIRAEAAVQISGILASVRKSVIEEARNARIDARSDAESVLTRRKERQTEAVNSIKELSGTGVTFEGLRKTEPESFKYLSNQFGGDEALKRAFVLNAPQDQILDKKIVGDHYIVSRQNPITGKISIENIRIEGLPADYSKTVDLGDRIMFFDPNDPQGKQFFVTKGLTPGQADDNKDNKNYKFTNEDRGKLTGVNFSSSDITQLEKDINEYGKEQALEGVTDPKQKQAIDSILGGTKKTVNLDRASLATFYGYADDDSKVGGFMGFGGSTGKQKLDEIEKVIARYRAIGMSDEDILKELQKNK
jgi:hypothetical protein